jgi:FemAB-related protein (PEP-CTERM system-associated)
MDPSNTARSARPSAAGLEIAAPGESPFTTSLSADAAEWNAFIAAHSGGSVYHRYEWGEINAEELGHEFIPLVARAGGELAGVLPLVYVRSRLFGRILCSMPFVNYGGPCATTREAAAALARAAMQITRECRANYLELRCTQPLPLDLPVSLRKVSMTLDLAADPDTLWNAFSHKHRKNVRRAYKDGLAVKSGGAELLPAFYSMIEQSWRSLGTPLYRRTYFERIVATFPDATRIFVCHREGAPLAAAFCGYHHCLGDGIVEGLWAGTTVAGRALDSNYVLYWEMIRDSCLRGYRKFHLGRSTADSGGEVFKHKWNATPSQLYWHFHRPDGGPMPELNVSNPRYQLATRVWRKLPAGVIWKIGPPLARMIP